MRSIVSVASCGDYSEKEVERALENVLSPFGNLDFIRDGTRVVIKANLVAMLKPESAAVTHPALLAGLCRMLSARGADVVVGDSPGGLYNSAYVNTVYAASGVKAVLAAGARLNQNFNHVHAENPGGLVLKELEYTSYLDDADVIINFCKLKTHGMMGMSACVKNLFGCIPGVTKPEYHYRYPDHRSFANMLLDLNERFRPRLCLVDAVEGMEGNGPTMGTPRHIGCILASDSPYACDAVCAGILGLKPEEVETVAEARARGLEPEAEIIGQPERFHVPDYKLVRSRKELDFNRELPGFMGKAFGGFVKACVCPVPAVTKGECIGCGKCGSICPAHAITMKSQLPRIDRGMCIRCFCCQEFCPKGAMKVRSPWIGKILSK